MSRARPSSRDRRTLRVLLALFALGLLCPGLHVVTTDHDVREIGGRLALVCHEHDHGHGGGCAGSSEEGDEEVEDEECSLLLVDAQTTSVATLRLEAAHQVTPAPTPSPRTVDGARAPPLTYAPKNSPPRTA